VCMTVANDRVIRTQAALRDELAELAAEYAPRRFALCWLDAKDKDGGVLAWGLAFPSGEVAVTGDDDLRVLGVFASAERARDLLGRGGELILVWLDEPSRLDLTPPGNP